MSRHTALAFTWALAAATTPATTTASASASANATTATTADADDIDDTDDTDNTDDTGGLRPGYLALHVIASARAGRSLALRQRRRRPRGGRGVHRRVREPDANLASSPSSPSASATTAEAGGRPLSGL